MDTIRLLPLDEQGGLTVICNISLNTHKIKTWEFREIIKGERIPHFFFLYHFMTLKYFASNTTLKKLLVM